MTTLFYAPRDRFDGSLVRLPEDEARHAVRVLRHREGDEIDVVDGEGGRHRIRLTQVDKHGATGRIVRTEMAVGEPSIGVTVGLATLKQPARFETFVEKAVELGVTEIVPLITERTERTRMKIDRLQNILVAAMKQSGRSRLPRLGEPVSFAAVIAAEDGGHRFICHEGAAPEASLAAQLHAADIAKGVRVLVGPEGGFTDAEVTAAEAAGWRAASLGPRRLRAETAALVAAAAVMLRVES